MALSGICTAGLTGWGCAPKVSAKTLRVVAYGTVSETLADEDELVILDARPLERYQAGHVPGAIHMPLSELDERLAKERFDPFDVVLVYGENPGSALAKALAKRLQTLGVDDVVYFEEGWAEYERRGGLVERDAE